MGRIAIPTARQVASARRRVMPDGMSGVGSIKFDGAGDYVTGQALTPGTSAWTMVAWVKIASIPAAGVHYTMMAAGDPGVGAHMLDFTLIGGVPTWRAGSSAYGWASYSDALWPAVGTWRCFGFVRRPGNAPLELWLGGGLRAVSAAFNPNVATSGSRLGSAFTTTWFADCKTSDARMYARDWSSAEFTDFMCNKPIDPTGIVRRWKCEAINAGTTREEIGGTDDAVTGAVMNADTPFKPRESAKSARVAA